MTLQVLELHQRLMILTEHKIKGEGEVKNSPSFAMKKYTLISLFILIVLSLIPPIDIVLRNPQYKYLLWMVLTAGFAGIYTIFIKTNVMVKIIAVGTFIDCFFSAAPYISF